MQVIPWFALVAALATTLPVNAADLSPDHWPAAERAKIEREERVFSPPYSGVVQGREMIVAATLSPIAVHAGLEALKQGGTAADAAAVVAMTQVTLELGSVISYAGVSQLIYYDARTRRTYSLDAGWASYLAETDPRSIRVYDDRFSAAHAAGAAPVGTGFGRQTMVPGFMAGIEAMHAQFGRLPFADLFQPAIWYADHGVRISSPLADYLRARQTYLWRTPEGRRFASMPDGTLPKAGDNFRQPDLAVTLRAVASHGASYMYTGRWGRDYVAAVRAEGGKATLEDMARYRPVWRKPAELRFAGATIFAPGVAPGLPCPVLEQLNLLSGAKFDSLGAYWRDPAAFEAYARALSWTFADYLSEVSAQPDGDMCKSHLAPGYEPGLRSTAAVPSDPNGSSGPSHTSSVIVVDRWGNVAALTHTINSDTWGDTGIVVGGVPISDAGAYFRNHPAAKGGARPPNFLSPIIALRRGKPVLAVGAVGLSQYQEVARLVAGVLAQGQDPIALQEAPTLLQQVVSSGQAGVTREIQVPAGAYDPDFLKIVKQSGLPVREVGRDIVGATKGTGLMVQIDQLAGTLSSAEIINRFGFAESDVQRRAAVPSPVQLASGVLEQYIGAYRATEPPMLITVVREGDHLSVDAGRGRLEMYARSPTEFFSKGDNIVHMTFKAAAGEKASSTVLRNNGGELTALRVDEGMPGDVLLRH